MLSSDLSAVEEKPPLAPGATREAHTPARPTLPFITNNGRVCYAGSSKTKGEPAIDQNPPMSVNGKVPPRRLANAARRPREYLTADEVERLMTAARARPSRYGQRDATMILLAYRHGLRVTELGGLRWDMLDLAQGHLHVRRLKNGRPSVHTVRGTELRALRGCSASRHRPPLPVHHRAAHADDRRRVQKAAGGDRGGGAAIAQIGRPGLEYQASNDIRQHLSPLNYGARGLQESRAGGGRRAKAQPINPKPATAPVPIQSAGADRDCPDFASHEEAAFVPRQRRALF